MHFGKIERVLILSFYLLDKPEKVNGFSKQFNDYFHKDVSTQTIMYEVAKIKNINPSNNTQSESDDLEYKALWNEYIEGDKVAELKNLYKSFKKGEFIESIEEIKGHSSGPNKPVVLDVPKDRPEIVEETKEVVKRDAKVVANALALAGYVCELDCSMELFISKDGNRNYTEGHHLVPLNYQKEFAHSLDVEANMVSLCPSCHRKLHYGIDSEKELETLYNSRIERLRKCNIEVSKEQLLLMYR